MASPRSFHRSIVIDRPIADVWDTWSDVRLLPQLSRSTTQVTGAPDRLTEVGQGFHQVVRAAGRCFESSWTVTSIAPEDHLTIEGSVGYGVRYQLTERVEALGPDRTRCTLEVEYSLPFGPLGRLAGRLGVERMAGSEAQEVLDALRAHLERAPAGSSA